LAGYECRSREAALSGSWPAGNDLQPQTSRITKICYSGYRFPPEIIQQGTVVLGALTVGAIAMRRTRILSDRAEHPEPSHHLAGSADIAEPLGELQEPNLGSLSVVREQDRKREASFPNVQALRSASASTPE
jgi:hypothetical protein